MRRLRRDEGFTLPELMIALSIGMVVVLSTLAVLDGATRRNDDLQRRTTGIQQGRAALDEVVRTLRSQVCVKPNDVTNLPPVAAADGSSITVYSDFGDASGVADKHTLTVASDGRLTDTVVKGAGTPSATSFTGTGTMRIISERITAQDANTPIFQYFGFNSASPPTPDLPLNSAGNPAVAAADLPRVARILVTMKANPEGKPNPKLTTSLKDQVFVRLADPDDAAPTPKCT